MGRRQGVTVLRRSAGRTIVLKPERGLTGPELLTGIHRIQRIPKNDKRGRRHTSTATVALLDTEEESAGQLVDMAEVRVRTKRGSGTGGQHRNVTDSAVELRHLPTGITVEIDSGRSQHQNLERARRILSDRLAETDRAEAARGRNIARQRQIATGERPSKDWTWNTQRNEVLCHSTGERYDLAKLRRGRV